MTSGSAQAAPTDITRAVPGLARQVWTLLKKDIAVELRSKESVPIMVIFSVVALVIFNFTFDLRTGNVVLLAPGILWVAFLFSGLLGLGRTFAREVERGSLDGLRASPVDPGAMYLSKVLGTFLFVGILQVILVLLVAALFDVPILHPYLALVLPLGGFGFAAVGTPFAAMTVNTRAREALLPVLLLPLLLPLVLAVVSGTALAMDGEGWEEIGRWINLLVGYDILFLTVSFLFFHAVVEE